ncbi:MAG TPA: hypothetical protein VK528_14410 [Flavobacterium sp.]|nr:hypothetical protein [Flavobacterium sp.]
MNTLLARLFEPTPEFFKKLQRVFAVITVIIGFMVALPGFFDFTYPEWMDKIFNGYTALLAIIPVFIAQLASAWRGTDGHVDQEKKTEYLKEQAKG